MQNYFEEKINVYRSPYNGLRIRWNIAAASSRLRDQLAQPFKKKKRTKTNRKIMHRTVKKNG